MSDEDKIMVSVQMDADTVEALERKAKKDNDNRSSVIRKIVIGKLREEGYV